MCSPDRKKEASREDDTMRDVYNGGARSSPQTALCGEESFAGSHGFTAVAGTQDVTAVELRETETVSLRTRTCMQATRLANTRV